MNRNTMKELDQIKARLRERAHPVTPCYQRHELAPGVHVDVPHEHEGVAVNKSMAEVIHTRHCLERVHNEDCMFWVEDHESADALTAAGFGPVKAAAAGALRDAAEMWHHESTAAHTLRARAATIEADQ